MNIEGSKVAVIGGAGLIGSHLVDRLREEEEGKISWMTQPYQTA